MYMNVEFDENPFSWRQVFPCGLTPGQTDARKPAVTFRNFAVTPRMKLKVSEEAVVASFGCRNGTCLDRERTRRLSIKIVLFPDGNST